MQVIGITVIFVKMRKKLRPYQLEVVSKLKNRLKESVHPLLVTMSVGSGKSICIAEILLWLEKAGFRALCLTLNSTLIQQNADAYKSQGGQCGIYAASINSKEIEPLVIFGSPQSVCNGIRKQEKISNCRFNAIIIDEAHNFNHLDSDTMYQRIVHHYGLLAQTYQYSYRIIGLTGTPFRGKGNSIVGHDQFFREEVCNIGASWLISQEYLTKPEFGLIKGHGYDFSNIRVNSRGKFYGSELQTIIDNNERLTGNIMRELIEVMKTRKGAFIFCCTKRHCEEAMRSLPSEETRIITAETSHEERKWILEQAKQLRIRYLVNVNVLLVGVDVPIFDVCVFLRPTESLVLFTQAIGRALRLHPEKEKALVLDFAGNLERHGDIDDPIINEALQPKAENEKEYVIPCLSCGVFNCPTARRCIGMVSGKRCDHFFEWKDCPGCGGRNDITTRICVHCGGELIDPNAKLSLKPAKLSKELFEVRSAKYWILENTHPSFNAMYQCKNGLRIYESFVIRDSRTANIFYGSFVKNMFDKPSQYYPFLHSVPHLRKMLDSINTPSQLECTFKENSYRIIRRIFYENIFDDSSSADVK
jgi:DNA repair protein RadD